MKTFALLYTFKVTARRTIEAESYEEAEAMVEALEEDGEEIDLPGVTLRPYSDLEAVMDTGWELIEEEQYVPIRSVD